MLPYLLFFALPALAAIAYGPQMKLQPFGDSSLRVNAVWMAVIFMLTIIVGFRYEVGGDWGNYYNYLFKSQHLNFSDISGLEDPAYWALNIFSLRVGFGMTGVNIIAGLLFSTGLVMFCLSLPRPWLAFACAVPYLVIVVGMGYTRQAVALAFVMIGFVMLSRQRFHLFVLYVLLGASFHRSAVVLIPLAALASSKNRVLTLVLVIVTSVLGYFVFLSNSAEAMLENYVDENMQSSGALIRLTMNAVPALLFLRYRNRLMLPPSEHRLWALLATTALVMLGAFFLTDKSTALDRMALYAIPLQLMVFAHLPDVLGAYGRRNRALVAVIILYYLATLLAWLNFATHARYWLPYQMGIG